MIFIIIGNDPLSSDLFMSWAGKGDSIEGKEKDSRRKDEYLLLYYIFFILELRPLFNIFNIVY